MADSCFKCFQPFGLFTRRKNCLVDGCDAKYHAECLTACDKCDYLVCDKHCLDHLKNCSGEEEEESVEEDSPVIYSDDKSIAAVFFDNVSDLSNDVSVLHSQGYVFYFALGDYSFFRKVK